MNMLKKSAAKAEPLKVPSLADAHADYAALTAKRDSLHAELGTLRTSRRDIERQIAADKSPEIRPAVAELLGDAESGKSFLRRKLTEIATRERDVEAAISVLSNRITTAYGPACVAVCHAIKPEFARRVAAMCKAMKELDAAHAHFDELRLALDAEDVQWGLLGHNMTPHFLGSSKEADRRIARYLREATEAGYNG